MRVADANKLNKLICNASNVVGAELDSLPVVSEKRMLSKLRGILDTTLRDMLVKHRSKFSERLISPTTVHHRASQEVIPACGHQTLQLLPLVSDAHHLKLH